MLRSLFLSLLGITSLAACGGSDDGTPGTCTAASGTGTLSIHITGLPAGAAASVSVADTPAARSVTADMDLTLTAGEHAVTAEKVAPAATIVRTAYAATVSAGGAAACVRSGMTTTVTVTYAAIPSSGKLWLGNSLAGAGMLGFAPATLAATGAPSATVEADTAGSAGFTFDRAGNLWVLGGTTADAALSRYAASTLGTSGAKTPDVMLTSPSVAGGAPGATVAAFDGAGNLWVSVVFAEKVVRFTPAQISASGNPTAAVEIGGIVGPSGIAFDAAGNMFVAAQGPATIVRFDRARLSASTTGADLSIAAETSGPVSGPLGTPLGLAFDAAGSLWANFDGTLVSFSPADLAGTGTKTLTPAIQIGADVLALSEGIAFDEGGGLWQAYSAGKFGRLGPTQLTSSGLKAPEVIVSSADVGYAGWFAIYPAPAWSPLAHRLP